MFRSRFAHSEYDAIIVGARCAGAATALLMARAGARVLVVDREARGSDTLSTHALMPPAVHQLNRWGLLDAVAASGAPPVRRTTFNYGDERVVIDVKPRGGVDAFYAPRRTALDSLLVEAALNAGAEVAFGVTLEALKFDHQGRVRGAQLRDAAGRSSALRAGLVIGADGRTSLVAQQVGAATLKRTHHQTAVVYGYVAGLENQGYRWCYSPGVAAGALPTHNGLHCVFASVAPAMFQRRLGRDPFTSMMKAIALSEPDLAEALYAAGPQDRLRRFTGAPGHLRQAYGPGWALVGDAGYFKDPVTAHGVSDAFLDAERVARAALIGDADAFADCQKTRDAFARPFMDVTDAIAALDWTLETLKSLHLDVNRCMKAEIEHAHSAPRPAAPIPADAADAALSPGNLAA